MQSKVTIYHEFGKRLANSNRDVIISKGWGTTEPAMPTKATKVQVVELAAEEFAVWSAAKKRTEETLWSKF